MISGDKRQEVVRIEIEQEGGDDVFVHYREIRGEGFKTLNEGQRVEFTLTTRDKGPAAEDVSPLD